MKKEELLKSRQYKTANEKQAYINNFPLDWCVRFDLSVLDVILFRIIEDATERQKYNAYTGSIKGLCAKTNVSLPTARNSLDGLYSRGFIDKKYIEREGKKVVAYTSNVKSGRDMGNSVSIEEQLEIVLARRDAVKRY